MAKPLFQFLFFLVQTFIPKYSKKDLNRLSKKDYLWIGIRYKVTCKLLEFGNPVEANRLE